MCMCVCVGGIQAHGERRLLTGGRWCSGEPAGARVLSPETLPSDLGPVTSPLQASVFPSIKQRELADGKLVVARVLGAGGIGEGLRRVFYFGGSDKNALKFRVMVAQLLIH